MKKTLRILSLTMVIAMMLSVFTGCALVDNIKDILGGIIPNPNPEPTPDDNTVTVTWYHGAKELKTEKVEKGTILESWTPEIADKEFQGWFAEASLTEEFDFTKAIEEDTDIFAAFKSNAHVEDTNEYYFIGAGAGDMAASNWNHKTETLFMEKQEVEGANVYKLTIKMYAGDKFQICYTGGWDGQMGIGYMVGAEYCDGINAYDKTEYTAADKKVAQVLDADGNVVFTGSDEYNKSYDVWNIWLADGQDGVYTFTFTTYPDSMQYNTLEWELVEKIEPMSETHQMYLIGSFNNWAPDDLTDEWKLAANDTKTSYTGIFTFAEEVQLKVYNTVNSDWIGYNGDNLKLAAGTYAFKYDTETNSFTYEALGYYLVGTFLDGDGVVNFAVKDGVTPKLTLVDGKYVGTLTVTDVTSNSNFSWIADQGKPGVMAVAVVYGSSLAIDEWYKDAANNDDNFYLAAGTYTVTFDLEAKTVTFTEATDPTPDPTPDPKPETPNVPTEDGKVTLYFTLKSDSEEIPSYAVPYITGSAWGNWADWCAKGAQKFTHLEGTNVWYVITDKEFGESNEYKILLNASVANGHAWKNETGPNGTFAYTSGQQIVNLGEHGFKNIVVGDATNANWVLVGNFNSWSNENGIALSKNNDGIFESDYLDVPANTEFKITNGNWISNDGGIEIANPTDAGNFKIETAGKYKVTFNATTGEVTVVEYQEPVTPDTPVETTKTTYVLDAATFEKFDKGAKADYTTEVVNDFFTIHWSANSKLDGSKKEYSDGYKTSLRFNFGGKTQIKPGETKQCISFTTTGKTTVKIWYQSGEDGKRPVTLYDAEGNILEENDPKDNVKNDPYYYEFQTVEAGTYYVGNSVNNNPIFKIEVVVEG